MTRHWKSFDVVVSKQHPTVVFSRVQPAVSQFKPGLGAFVQPLEDVRMLLIIMTHILTRCIYSLHNTRYLTSNRIFAGILYRYSETLISLIHHSTFDAAHRIHAEVVYGLARRPAQQTHC